MSGLIIFDFDGVVADSEYLANLILAEVVTELGTPTTVEDCYSQYMGKRFEEVVSTIETAIGRKLPESFPSEFQERTLSVFRNNLTAVNGVRQYIERFGAIPRCIASSSSPDRLAFCLDVLGFQEKFGENVFSASMVKKGCLLYTSPSPRDKRQSRMPSSA